MPKPYPKEFRDDVVQVALNREPGVRIKDVAADFGMFGEQPAGLLGVVFGLGIILATRYSVPLGRLLWKRSNGPLTKRWPTPGSLPRSAQHGRASQQSVLGAVAAKVVSHAPCDVYIAHTS